MAEHDKTNASRIHTIYIGIIIILILGLAGEFYYFHYKRPMRQNAMQAASTGQRPAPGMRMAMAPQKPPTESDQQKQQITAGTDTANTEKTFNITGGNFYFVPNKINVNKGDKVIVYMTNAGGFHDFVIDELGVKTPVIKTGEVATATFIASKSGSFVYYCDVKGHRQKGMWGTLTVQ